MWRKYAKGLVLLCMIMVTFFCAGGTALAGDYYNQDVTAYVASSGAKTSSGKTPKALDVAVHKNASGGPIFPYGTIIFLKYGKRLTVDRYGNTSSTFNVQDTGTGSGRTTYWFDIYFGVNNVANTVAAVNFGIQKVDYSTH